MEPIAPHGPPGGIGGMHPKNSKHRHRREGAGKGAGSQPNTHPLPGAMPEQPAPTVITDDADLAKQFRLKTRCIVLRQTVRGVPRRRRGDGRNRTQGDQQTGHYHRRSIHVYHSFVAWATTLPIDPIHLKLLNHESPNEWPQRPFNVVWRQPVPEWYSSCPQSASV